MLRLCHSKFSAIFDDLSQRLLRIVIEQTGPVYTRRLRQEFVLRFNRFEWIEIVSHHPCERHVRAGRNQISKAKQRVTVAFESRALHRTVVSRICLYSQARRGLVVGVLQFKLA